MGYALGVDLGTTFTAAAVSRDGRVEIVTLGLSGATIPSVVFLGEDGTILVGEPARRRALAEPGRVVREFKRRLGDPTPLLVGGSPLSADVLTGRLLGAVVALVAEREGGRPDAVSVTHPANWGPYKIDLLRNACRVAGLDDVVFVSEPVAAATQYAATDGLPVGSTVALYDLGGGTFDAAVLRRDEGGFVILGQPEGIERIGGIDFDAAVVGYVDHALGGALSALDLDDSDAAGAAARIQRECVEAKEALSDDTSATIGVYLPNRTDHVRITRDEFEQRIRPALQETVTSLHRALTSAGLSPADVDCVLLVGGSSRIPLVAELVGAEFGRPVSVNAHPKHTVAMGAARLAVALAVDSPAPLGDSARTPDPSEPDALAEQQAVPAPVAPVGFGPPAPPAPPPTVAVSPAHDDDDSDGAVVPLTPLGAASAGGPRRTRVIAAAAAGVVVAAALAVVLLIAGGDDDGGNDDGVENAVGVQLISFTAERDADGICTAAWNFTGDFQSGDQLRLLWRGTAVAEGAASSADEVSGVTGFDEMWLVRSGQTVQIWQPSPSAC